MLSKFYNALKQESFPNQIDMVKLTSAFTMSLKKEYSKVECEKISPGGTLGVFFRIFIDGKKYFVKTHLQNQNARDNLIKEIDIMLYLYGNQISIIRRDINLDNNWFVFMIMDYLQPINKVPNPQILRNCISDYQTKLTDYKFLPNYSFEHIIDAAEISYALLNNAGIISNKIRIFLAETIEYLKNAASFENFYIGHGDLSNVNIMSHISGKLIIVDWEDALITFREWDFLYWLTFLSQNRIQRGGYWTSATLSGKKEYLLCLLLYSLNLQFPS